MSARSLRLAGIGAIVAFAAPAAAHLLHPTAGLGAAAALLAALTLGAGHFWQARLRAELADIALLTRETAAQASLLSLGHSSPIPPSPMALSPLALLEVLGKIAMHPAPLVVECGSGVSTFYIAAALHARGAGRLIAFEEDQAWASMMNAHLRRTGLASVAEVFFAPLETRPFRESVLHWYEDTTVSAALDASKGLIDVLLVDGPIGRRALARCAALPALWARLGPGAVVYLDDARREDEQNVLLYWCKNFPVSSHELSTLHGLAVVRRLPSGAQ